MGKIKLGLSKKLLLCKGAILFRHAPCKCYSKSHAHRVYCVFIINSMRYIFSDFGTVYAANYQFLRFWCFKRIRLEWKVLIISEGE